MTELEQLLAAHARRLEAKFIDFDAEQLRQSPTNPRSPTGQLTPIVLPEAQNEQQPKRLRRAIIAITAAAASLTMVTLVAKDRRGGEEQFPSIDVGPSTSMVATTVVNRNVPIIRRAGLDVVGSGAFRITGKPGQLHPVDEAVSALDGVVVLGESLRRTTHVLAADDHGHTWQLEAFETPPDVGVRWKAGNFPASARVVRYSTQRNAVIETHENIASVTWAYDEHRAIRYTLTGTTMEDGTTNGSEEMLMRSAGMILAAERIPVAGIIRALGNAPTVHGQGYDQAQVILAAKGVGTRFTLVEESDAPENGEVVSQGGLSGEDGGDGHTMALVVRAKEPPPPPREGQHVYPGQIDRFTLPFPIRVPRYMDRGFGAYVRTDTIPATGIHGLGPPATGWTWSRAYPWPAQLPNGEFIGVVDDVLIPLDQLLATTATFPSGGTANGVEQPSYPNNTNGQVFPP